MEETGHSGYGAGTVGMEQVGDHAHARPEFPATTDLQVRACDYTRALPRPYFPVVDFTL